VHDNPLSFWPIYPGSLRKLFTRAFTVGLHDPDARVMENEWRKEMCALRDAIFYCPHCGAENFFDLELVRQKKRSTLAGAAVLAARQSAAHASGRRTRFAAGHAQSGRATLCPSPGRGLYNFSTPLAEVVAHPLGLKNLSRSKWTSRSQNGSATK
jgi:hypothetical protein